MLIENIRISPHFSEELEGEVVFPLFSKVIDVQGFTSESINYANECAKLLTELDESIISQLCQASIRYCNWILKVFGEEEKSFTNERDVLKLIEPSSLIIEDGASKPVIHMELNCEWEEEHGMEWIIRDNEVQYVGSFDGMNPFDDYTESDEWNFARNL